MTVRDFIAILQDALDRAVTYSTPNKEVIATFIAPNSGFCGPTIRPKFLGYPTGTTMQTPTEARYGLTRLQVERLLEAFDVTLPVEGEYR